MRSGRSGPLAASLIALVWSAQAAAAEPAAADTPWLTRIGQWGVQSTAEYCLIRFEPLRADRELSLIFRLDASVTLAATDLGWRVEPRRQIDVQIEAGGQRSPLRAETIRPSAFLRGIRVEITQPILTALARAPDAIITPKGEPPKRFDMTGMARAVATARACLDRLRAVYANPLPVPPPPPAPFAPPPLRVGPAKARLKSGWISDVDYPARAMPQRAEGVTQTEIRVDAEGLVANCRVAQSSGNVELDFAACKLIEERFNYYPALDAESRPIPDEVKLKIRWEFPADEVAPPGQPR